MNSTWPEAALELQRSVRQVVADHEGVDLARSAEEKPWLRTEVVEPALRSLGVLDLDAYGDEEEAAAAALTVRALGEAVVPWPIVRTLAVPADLRDEIDALYVADGPVTHLEHADLFTRACVVGLTAPHTATAVQPSGTRRFTPLDPFGTPVVLGSEAGLAAPHEAVVMSLVLDGMWIAGALDTAVRLAAQYATTRRQFGKPIGRFGEIRWRLADMSVAHDGLDELAMYTWFLAHHRRATLADALALRVGALEAAEAVLRNAHQVLGAIGLCEEHDLTVFDRHLTPTLMRPLGTARSLSALLEAVNRDGFTGIFDVPPRP
jgi:hypothetical protein